jgi:hypothetical protein
MYYARHKDLVAVEEAAIFWDVTPCSFVTNISEETVTSPFKVQGKIFLPEDRSKWLLHNTSNSPSDKASHPRRRQSSRAYDHGTSLKLISLSDRPQYKIN